MRAAAAWATRHARAVLAITAMLALAAALAATRIPTDAGTHTLVDTDTASYRATQELRHVFGEDPVVILAQGDLRRLLLTSNLGSLLRLESCLAGKVPPAAEPIPGPCAELARLDPVEFLAGPATFLNEAVIQIDSQLERLAARVPPDELRRLAIEIAARYGIRSLPSLGNPEFTSAVVFDRGGPSGTPKARLSYLFPNAHSAQIVIRLRPDLSEGERHQAIELIRAAVNDTTPRKECGPKGTPAPCFELRGGRYVISGVPVVVDGVSRALKDALLVLLAVALVVMASVLLLVFRSRFRLLPLAIALAAAALTFGLFDLFGGSLTMASIAVLPILIGLAVDYAIQFQARYDEAVASGASRGAAAARGSGRRWPGDSQRLVLRPPRASWPWSCHRLPWCASFGLLLVVGIAIAFALALTSGFAALSLRRVEAGVGSSPDAGGVPFFAPAHWREKLPPRRKTQPAEGSTPAPGPPEAHPRADPCPSLAGAGYRPGAGCSRLGGWVPRSRRSPDFRELAPQSIEAVRDLNRVAGCDGRVG